MTARSLFTSLLARLEGAFDRAVTAAGREAEERASGEFISTLIIDHGAGAREAEKGSRRSMPRS